MAYRPSTDIFNILVISVPKIFVNGQFYFNLSSKTWSHVFFGTQCSLGIWCVCLSGYGFLGSGAADQHDICIVIVSHVSFEDIPRRASCCHLRVQRWKMMWRNFGTVRLLVLLNLATPAYILFTKLRLLRGMRLYVNGKFRNVRSFKFYTVYSHFSDFSSLLARIVCCGAFILCGGDSATDLQVVRYRARANWIRPEPDSVLRLVRSLLQGHQMCHQLKFCMLFPISFHENVPLPWKNFEFISDSERTWMILW